MSFEISVTTGIKISNTNSAFGDQIPTNTLSVNQNRTGFAGYIAQNLSNTAVNINLSPLNTFGWAQIQHIGVNTSNFVQWGTLSGGSFVPAGRLYPGERAQVRLEPGMVYQWRSNTNATDALVRGYND